MSLGWFDDLPPGWTSTQLRRIARIFAGGTPDRKRDNFWSGGTVPWLNSGSVNQDVITRPSELVTTLALSAGTTRFVSAKSVVVALAGQGKTKGMAARTEIQTTLNQSLAAIEPSRLLDYRFLHYWLKSNYMNIRNLAGGDLRDGLNLDHIGGIHIPLPNPAVQRQIADYLDFETAEIDAFMADLLRLRDLSLEEHEVLRSSLLLGDVPGSSAAPLKYLARVTVGIVVEPSRYYTEDGVPALRGLNVAAERVPIGHVVKITSAGHAANPKSKLSTGDVVVVRTGQAGTAAVVPQACDGWNAIDLLIVKPQAALRGDYLAALINSREVQSEIRHRSVGAIQAHFNVEALANLRVPHLPAEEQGSRFCAWAKKSGAVQEAIADIDSAIALAKERRAALIAAAVTGKIDVTAKHRPAVDSIQIAIEEAR